MIHPLRAFRQSKGWSQEELASICGLSGRTVQRVERDETASLETRKALAAGLDLGLEEVDRLIVRASRKENEMTTPQTPAAQPIAFKWDSAPWLRFAAHLGAFMLVLTWLGLMAANAGWNPEIIPPIGIAWGGLIAVHLAMTIHAGMPAEASDGEDETDGAS